MAEIAVHGWHCPGDMALRMRKVLARPWAGVTCFCLVQCSRPYSTVGSVWTH